MIVRRGYRRRSLWRAFGAHHAGLCDALQLRPPNSPAKPLTLDDVRYFIGYATAAHMVHNERIAAIPPTEENACNEANANPTSSR
jgi:hypothetical protein